MVNRRIRETVKLLKSFPELGTVVPEFENSSIRELLVFSFRIIYEVKEKECHVLFVFHASRDLKRYFGLPEDEESLDDSTS